MLAPRHRRRIREPTFIIFLLETIARIILNEESRRHLSEEEYINWFLHRVFTLDSFLEIISFSIICFYIGGGFLFLALICCHIVARYLKLEW
ncbi:hypothetical protein L5515_014657 [Caenorhabditis briggsae]|uniref:Uncharacterized protein n=1 Tax=Caenorhabditis briggsae TaxID=6238 RepID=A0AAE9ECU9_CAEBR|nr:hypothetical protein L5515_014657 [Caenorhabditis briggsae]